jgi:hypothetical protein
VVKDYNLYDLEKMRSPTSFDPTKAPSTFSMKRLGGENLVAVNPTVTEPVGTIDIATIQRINPWISNVEVFVPEKPKDIDPQVQEVLLKIPTLRRHIATSGYIELCPLLEHSLIGPRTDSHSFFGYTVDISPIGTPKMAREESLSFFLTVEKCLQDMGTKCLWLSRHLITLKARRPDGCLPTVFTGKAFLAILKTPFRDLRVTMVCTKEDLEQSINIIVSKGSALDTKEIEQAKRIPETFKEKDVVFLLADKCLLTRDDISKVGGHSTLQASVLRDPRTLRSWLTEYLDWCSVTSSPVMGVQIKRLDRLSSVDRAVAIQNYRNALANLEALQSQKS